MKTPRLRAVSATCALIVAACSAPAQENELRAPSETAQPSASSGPVALTPPVKKLLPYPDNKASDTADVLFGQTVKDPYRWLEDEKAPAVKDWVSNQDRLARSELAKLPEREAIAARLKELMYVDVLSAPIHRGTRYFFTRKSSSQEKSVAYFKEGKKGEEKVLLDPNSWSKDGSTSLGNWSVSQDGKKVAYTVHENNKDEATMHLLDVETGKESKVDLIEGAKYASASWTRTNDGFYYTWLPTDPKIPGPERPGFAEVRFHKLGTDAKTDEIVHEKLGDPEKFLGAEVSEDGSTVFLSIDAGWSGNELYFRDAHKKDAFVPLAQGFKSHYSAIAYGGSLYVTTDEGAPKWRVFKVDPKKPERASWKEIVPEDKDATIDSAGIIGGKLALTYLVKATSRMEIRSLDGKVERSIQLPGIGTAGAPTGRQGEDEAWFGFESFTTPYEVHSLSVKTGKTELYSQVKVPIDKDRFTVEQVTFASKDKTPVTMFIVHAKDLKRDGSNKALLYGYGGFQVSETPAFASTIFPWLERGGIYAVANIRGGGEYGEAWHQQGMRERKQNVFDDFIGAAEYLVANKYTSPEHLAVSGGSNGGLLMGAVMTERPDLFGAVICAVPLLDMVRYEKFGSGRTWASEYGSASDESMFKALFAYSPYHHVQSGTHYPALLMLSADSDDRVDPMHARKFTAFLQDASTGGPVLMRVEKNSGHGGADMRKAEVEKGADRYAFMLAYTSGGAPTAADASEPK